MAQASTHLVVKTSSMPKEMLDKVVRFASSVLNEELNESVCIHINPKSTKAQLFCVISIGRCFQHQKQTHPSFYWNVSHIDTSILLNEGMESFQLLDIYFNLKSKVLSKFCYLYMKDGMCLWEGISAPQ